jgi:hypothetical protein
MPEIILDGVPTGLALGLIINRDNNVDKHAVARRKESDAGWVDAKQHHACQNRLGLLTLHRCVIPIYSEYVIHAIILVSCPPPPLLYF